jgi:hypothetical protein
MWIEVQNIECKVVRANVEEVAWLRTYLTFEDTSYYGKGRKTVFKSDGTFPGGLLPLVQDSAKNASMQIDLIDRRTRIVQRDPNADLAWLRDYQREAAGRPRSS